MNKSQYEQFKSMVELAANLKPGEILPVQPISRFKRFLQFINQPVTIEFQVGYIIGIVVGMIIMALWM